MNKNMILYIVSFLLNWFNKYCGEDEYQKSRFLDKPPYIYSVIRLKKNIENIYDKITQSLHQYFTNRYPDNTDILVYKEVETVTATETHILEIYKKENTLILYLDHRYFSGYYFLILGENLFDNKSKEIMNETYIPFVSEYYILKFIYYYYYVLPKLPMLSLIKNKEDMRRENFILDIDEIKQSYHHVDTDTKISKKFYIVHHLLHYIYDKMGFTRPMRVLIPLAFKTTAKKYNNVGCIIFDFNKENIKTMVKIINQVSYQAHATNLLQGLNNYGKKARSSVDLVLSMGYFEYEDEYVENFYATYENIADYPIYCISITFNNTVHTTITYMNEL